MTVKMNAAVFMGKPQIEPALKKFCRAIGMLEDLRNDPHFSVEDFEGYHDWWGFEQLIRWLADVHNGDESPLASRIAVFSQTASRDD